MIPHRSFARLHIGSIKMAAAMAALSALCIIMLASCDESLPPRDDPQNFLSVKTEPYYEFGRTAQIVYLTIRIRNVYTETFSSPADIYGTINILWKDRPEAQRHYTLTPADLKTYFYDPATGKTLTSRSSYNSALKILTIPENEYVVFQVKWDLVLSDTIRVLNEAPFHPNPANPAFDITDDLTFVVTTNIHLYNNAPTMYPEPLIYKQRLLRIH